MFLDVSNQVQTRLVLALVVARLSDDEIKQHEPSQVVGWHQVSAAGSLL